MQKIVLVDDLDGSTAADTIRFGIDGHTYEIDLSEENARELRAVIAPFVKVARPSRSGGKPTRNPASSSPKSNGHSPSNREVRLWAQKKKIKVSPRGRIPSEVIDKYLADVG